MASIKLQEQILIPKISELLSQYNFKFDSKNKPKRFIYDRNVFKIRLNLQLSNSAVSTNINEFQIYFEEIEKYILMLNTVPSFDLSRYKVKEIFMFSVGVVSDLRNQYAFKNHIKSESDINKWFNHIQEYILNDGLEFINNNSSLFKVQNQLNMCFATDKNIFNHLRLSPDSFFRFLIVSKLNDDPEFKLKRNYVDEIFSGYENVEWDNCYRDFKKICNDINPLTKEQLLHDYFTK